MALSICTMQRKVYPWSPLLLLESSSLEDATAATLLQNHPVGTLAILFSRVSVTDLCGGRSKDFGSDVCVLLLNLFSPDNVKVAKVPMACGQSAEQRGRKKGVETCPSEKELPAANKEKETKKQWMSIISFRMFLCLFVCVLDRHWNLTALPFILLAWIQIRF